MVMIARPSELVVTENYTYQRAERLPMFAVGLLPMYLVVPIATC